LWDLDCITSKQQHTKIYAQMVQELADYAQYFASLAAPNPFAYLIAKGWTVPDYYNYA